MPVSVDELVLDDMSPVLLLDVPGLLFMRLLVVPGLVVVLAEVYGRLAPGWPWGSGVGWHRQLGRVGGAGDGRCVPAAGPTRTR